MNAVIEQPAEIQQWNVWIDGAQITIGFWEGIPNPLYHAGPGISKSGLDAINESPLYYKTLRENPRPETPTLALGTAVHAAVLEPERFERDFVPDPFPGSRSKDAIAARQLLELDGKTIIRHEPNPESIWDRGDWDTIRYVRDAILAHPEAAIFLDPADGLSELSCYWIDPVTHRLCKCRHDFLNRAHRMIVDLKTATDATFSGFQRAVHDYRYDVAAAWYQDGTRLAGEHVEAMVFVVAEKKPPYHVGTYEIDKDWVREGRVKYQQNMRVYHECMKAQEWPSIPDHTRILTQPGFAKYNPIS
ncbi:MAG: PD-(D/E)XK nuclease-like domain-containing protein [Gammaproteobacteria bacterium]